MEVLKQGVSLVDKHLEPLGMLKQQII